MLFLYFIPTIIKQLNLEKKQGAKSLLNFVIERFSLINIMLDAHNSHIKLNEQTSHIKQILISPNVVRQSITKTKQIQTFCYNLKLIK